MGKSDINLSCKTVHFINAVIFYNTGDIASSPLNYFSDYFCKYSLNVHDVTNIQWNLIVHDDIVIIGGGGLINLSSEFNKIVNLLLDRCETVIGWGLGLNQANFLKDITPKINFDKFSLIGIRDFANPMGYPFVPCSTCMSPFLRKNKKIVRDIGLIDNVLNKKISGYPYDKIDMSLSIDQITDFISESGVILTRSYHATYWSMLMGKKVIVLNPTDNRFDYFKYKPVFLREPGDKALKTAIDMAAVYPNILDEYVEVTMDYFKQVCHVVENKIPNPDNTQTLVNILMRMAAGGIERRRGWERIIDGLSDRIKTAFRKKI